MVYERGVHVRTIVTRESEWTEDQQAWMLALAVYRAGLCHRCYGELAETASAAFDPDNRAGTHVYKAKPPKRCHRCTALMASEKTYSAVDKKTGEPIVRHSQALIHHVEKVERPRRR